MGHKLGPRLPCHNLVPVGRPDLRSIGEREHRSPRRNPPPQVLIRTEPSLWRGKEEPKVKQTMEQITLRPETSELLERRARSVGARPGEYAATLIERVLEGFEVRDSAERTFHRRLEEIAPLAR